MTPSASVRFRPSTTPSTSITSSWRSRRATGRIRGRSTRSMFRRRAPIRPGCNRRGSQPATMHPRPGRRALLRQSPRIQRATSRRTRSRPAAIPPLRLAPPLRPRSRPWFRFRPSPNSSLATPRSASITRDNSPQRRFRSISPRAARSAKPRRRSTKQSSASACLQQSEAHSPAPRRPFSNRNRACRFCSALRW